MERNNRGELFRYGTICLATVLHLSHCFLTTGMYMRVYANTYRLKKNFIQKIFLIHYPFFYVLINYE